MREATYLAVPMLCAGWAFGDYILSIWMYREDSYFCDMFLNYSNMLL